MVMSHSAPGVWHQYKWWFSSSTTTGMEMALMNNRQLWHRNCKNQNSDSLLASHPPSDPLLPPQQDAVLDGGDSSGSEELLHTALRALEASWLRQGKVSETVKSSVCWKNSKMTSVATVNKERWKEVKQESQQDQIIGSYRLFYKFWLFFWMRSKATAVIWEAQNH